MDKILNDRDEKYYGMKNRDYLREKDYEHTMETIVNECTRQTMRISASDNRQVFTMKK